MPFFREICLLIGLRLALSLMRQRYPFTRLSRRCGNINDSRAIVFAQTIFLVNCRSPMPKTETFHKDGRYLCSADCRQQHYTY
jgi:hypothetical protein